MYYLLLNRFNIWIKIHNLEKYLTMLKNLCFRKWKQQKHNNKKKTTIKTITIHHYHRLSCTLPKYLKKQSKHG